MAVTSMSEAAKHAADVERWRAARYAALQRPVGWLSLAGLDWLQAGENPIGTDAANVVVVRHGAPRAGAIVVGEDGSVSAHAEPGVDGLRHDGLPLPAKGLPLVTDADGEPTLVELGPLRICVIRRGDRLAARTWDMEAPALREFGGIPHFPVDIRWRIAARFEPADPARRVVVPDVIGSLEEEPSPGRVWFDADGGTWSLEALEGGPDGELWLVFGDATNGVDTYDGGRFLYTPPPASDGNVTLDFNRAYNPPCVFTPYATCPLPWPENRLPIRIEAGERYPLAVGSHARPYTTDR
jgi:uncharacterized protein (DUF1684 family)